MPQRVAMRGDQIADMNVVADAGAVGRRIIAAEDVDLRAKPERRLDGDLDQMRRAVVDCPMRPCGSAPATLK